MIGRFVKEIDIKSCCSRGLIEVTNLTLYNPLILDKYQYLSKVVQSLEITEMV